MTDRPSTPRRVSALKQANSGEGLKAANSHPTIKLSEHTYARAQDCVQCGLCLPACPTYLITGNEADSPRGRIRIMKGLADNRIEPTPATIHHLDLCLDCRGCESACPSGVVYHELIEETRARLVGPDAPGLTIQQGTTPPLRSWFSRVVAAFTHHVLPYPRRLKLVLIPVVILQWLGLWRWVVGRPFELLLPDRLLNIMRLVPTGSGVWQDGPLGKPLGVHHAAEASHQPPDPRQPATAALFTGCVAAVLFPKVNRQSVSLLGLARCSVSVPPAQVCCGAIHHHSGHEEQAKAFARRNIDAFLDHKKSATEPIVNTIAGCGAMLKAYADLLRDDPVYADRAKEFSSCVRDISELLVELKLPTPKHRSHATVTYHDACHLIHAQQIAKQPRQLLAAIPGLRLIPLPESDLCCGAAGSYNLMQPEMAAQLGRRKARHIQATMARVCVTGNVGCAMHIRVQMQRLGLDVQIEHPVTLLYHAYFGGDSCANPSQAAAPSDQSPGPSSGS